MNEYPSPICISGRNLLMPNVEIIHPQQPRDISSNRMTIQGESFDNKESQTITPQNRLKLKNNKNFFFIVNAHVLLKKFLYKLKEQSHLQNKFPKSVYLYRLLETYNKGNYSSIRKIQQKDNVLKIIKIIWKILTSFSNILIIIILPLENISSNFIILLIILIINIMNMFIKFIKPIYQEGVLIRQRIVITQSYFSSLKFIVDFLRTLTLLGLILHINSNRIFEQIIIFILFLCTMSNINLKFICTSFIQVKFLEMFIQIIATCHFFTSSYYQYIDQDNYDYGDLIILSLNQFICSIESISIIQEVIILLLHLKIIFNIICLAISYTNVIQQQKQLYDLKSYLKTKQISEFVLNRVLSFYKALIFNKQNQYQDHEQLLKNALKPKLFQELQLQIQQNFLLNLQLFKQFTHSTRQQLIYSMEKVHFKPNEYIYNYNQIDDQSIYFIQSGKIMILHSNTELYTLKEGNYFGDVSFFSGISRNASSLSIGYSVLYKITRQQYLKAVSSINEDLEQAQRIKDKILFQSDYSVINRKCENCSSKYHLIQFCPQLHYIPNKNTIISKLIYPHQMKRKKQNRNRQRYCNVLLNQGVNSVKAAEFQISSETEFSEEDLDIIDSDPLSEEFEKKKNSQFSPDPILTRIANPKRTAGFGYETDNIIRTSQQQILPIEETSQEISSVYSSNQEGSNVKFYQQQLSSDQNKGKQNSTSKSPSQIIQSRSRSYSQQIFSEQDTFKKQNQFTYSLSQISQDELLMSQFQKQRIFSKISNSGIQILKNENPVYQNFIELELDRGQNFNNYFPYNNIINIIKTLNDVVIKKKDWGNVRQYFREIQQ